MRCGEGWMNAFIQLSHCIMAPAKDPLTPWEPAGDLSHRITLPGRDAFRPAPRLPHKVVKGEGEGEGEGGCV
jgi:hypothetical protein